MSTQNKHFMKSPDGVIKAVPANEWGRYRAQGYTFSNEKEFQAQTQGATPDRDDDVDVVPTMDNTKAEIVDYLESNGYDVDTNDTKAELLAAIEG